MTIKWLRFNLLMKLRRCCLPVTLVLLSTAALCPRANACSCAPGAYGPACQLIARAQIVFLGVPVEVIPDPTGGSTFGRHNYRFKIDRVYKGLDPSIQEVLLNPMNSTSCATEFAIGKPFLMFTGIMSREPLVLVAGGCSGSRRADLNKADIEFLDSWLEGKSETTVYGKVLQWVTDIGLPSEEESAPLAGAEVTLTRADRRFTRISEPDGSFAFKGIESGDYQISARLDPYNNEPVPYEVAVVQGGCNQVFIQLKAHSSIEGVLLLADGTPVPRQRVELLRRNHAGNWYETYKMWASTDDHGVFRFRDMESGEYLLGHEIWRDSPSESTPYPTLYYPNGPDRAKAQIITLAPHQALRDLKLTLPQPHNPRTITIKVLWPDGRTAGENLLQVFAGRGLIRNVQGAGPGGIVTFTGYQERGYEFTARYWVDNLHSGGPVSEKRIAKSDPVKLEPGKDAAEIVLVLNREMRSEDDR